MMFCLFNPMSTSLRVAILVMGGLLLVCNDSHAAAYDVYIFAGQSNMDGRGDVKELPTPIASEQPGVLIYYVNPANPSKRGEEHHTSSGWQTLRPGYSVPPGARSKALPSGTFGPELSFAYAMQKATQRKNPVAIIKITRGGTNLRSDWSPDGFMYKAMVSEVQKALEAMKARGDSGTLCAMLWHQGESDAGKPEQYQSRLELLIADVRGALGRDDLPFLIGELAPTKPAGFRKLQQAIAEENDHVEFVSSEGLKTSDGTHFDSASQVTLGKRFCAVMLTTLFRQQRKD
jgi:iduronate 2-sulfatase